MTSKDKKIELVFFNQTKNKEDTIKMSDLRVNKDTLATKSSI